MAKFIELTNFYLERPMLINTDNITYIREPEAGGSVLIKFNAGGAESDSDYVVAVEDYETIKALINK